MCLFYRVAALVSCAALLISFAPSVQARTLTFPTVANLTHGDIVKIDGSSTLYYFGKNDQRYLFPDAGTYFSWYETFDHVKTISGEDLSQIPLGGMVYYKPFDVLVKTADDSTVYWVYLGGQIVPVQDESAAVALEGETWQTKVRIVDPAILGRYEIENSVALDETVAVGIGFVEELVSAFIFGPVPTIAENQQMTDVTGVYIYESPSRFAATDETEDCGTSICAYNEATVAKNGTLKFVNDTTEAMTVVDDNGEWSTGTIPPHGGIAVVTIKQERGTHFFHAIEDEDVIGKLIVEEVDECGGSYICSLFE